jgi:uncharacterized membrane-anchored protein YhcB (DUF1043 family)
MEQPKSKKSKVAMVIGLVIGFIIGFVLMLYFMG